MNQVNAEAVASAHAKRLAGVDTLLPTLPTLTANENNVPLTATSNESNEKSVAIGLATQRSWLSGDIDAMAHPLREHHLAIRLAGPKPAKALSILLERWNVHLDELTASDEKKGAAVVPRPSRDTVGNAELFQHGFAPVRVTAVRPADRLAAGPSMTPGVSIRAAEPSDLRTVAALQLELLRFDAQFGIFTEYADIEEHIAAAMANALAAANPTVWIAELYGKPLGMVHLQLPPESSWMSEYVPTESVGYLNALAVAEQARSAGVGTALAAHAHQVFDQAGVEVVTLHHTLANPRSTPFWCAQGYRPLWTHWYRYPAVR